MLLSKGLVELKPAGWNVADRTGKTGVDVSGWRAGEGEREPEPVHYGVHYGVLL